MGLGARTAGEVLHFGNHLVSPEKVPTTGRHFGVHRSPRDVNENFGVGVRK